MGVCVGSGTVTTDAHGCSLMDTDSYPNEPYHFLTPGGDTGGVVYIFCLKFT